jgi:hypothetical protein
VEEMKRAKLGITLICILSTIVLMASQVPTIGTDTLVFVEGNNAFGNRVNQIPLVNFTDVTPVSGYYNQGDTNVEMLSLNFTALNGGAGSIGVLQGITVNHTGTGPPTDITEVTVYEDVNQNGVLEPGATDGFPLGSASTWTFGRFLSITFDTNLNIIRDDFEHIFIVYNFSASASGTHGARVDGLANISADKQVLDPNTFLPIQSVNLSINPGPLVYDVTNPATYLGATPTSNFFAGQDVIVTIRSVHSWTEDDILGAKITITDPSSTVVVNDLDMTLGNTGVGWKEYSYTYALPLSPAALRGAYTVGISGEFSQGLQINSTVFNVINGLPQITGAIGPYEKSEDETPWQENLTTLKSDLEDSGPALVWSLAKVDTSLVNATVTGDIIDFILEPDATGSNLINLTLTDSDLGTDTIQFWLNVTPVNDPPAITLIPDINATEDDANWTLNLTTYKTDLEDPADLLNWSVKDVNSSIMEVIVEDDILTFSLVPDAFGIDNINVTLTDSDNATSWQWVTVNVTPVNDAPAWSDVDNLYITNGTNFTSILDLADFVTDVDDTDLTFAFVSNTNSTEVKVKVAANGLVDVEILNETFIGMSSVIVSASDGVEAPQAEFDILVTGGENLVLEATLVAPAHGSILSDKTVELSWHLSKEEGEFESITYSVVVYIASAYDDWLDGALMPPGGWKWGFSSLTETKYSFEAPKDKAEYYWTVSPEAGSFTGECVSGGWNFTVNTSFVHERNVSVSLDKDNITLEQGGTDTIMVTITNLGNDVDVIVQGLDLTGFPGGAEWADYYNLTLDPQEDITIQLNLWVDDDAEPWTHYLKVQAFSQDVSVFDEATLEVNVLEAEPDDDVTDDTDADGLPDSWETEHFGNLDQGPSDDYDNDGKTNLEEYNANTDPTKAEGDDDKDDKDEESSWWFWIVALIIAFLIIIVIVIVILRQKKYEEEEEDYEDEEEEDEEEEDELDEEDLLPEPEEGAAEELRDTPPEEALPPAAHPIPEEGDEALEGDEGAIPEWEDPDEVPEEEEEPEEGEEEEEEVPTGEPHAEEKDAEK